jgi:predicted RNase H-like nuclease (RuvC/YqgF family)
MSTIEQLWQDLIDKDDRNSPEEHPDMALITFDEFANYLRAAEQQVELLTARVAALQEEVGRLKGEYKFLEEQYDGMRRAAEISYEWQRRAQIAEKEIERLR